MRMYVCMMYAHWSLDWAAVFYLSVVLPWRVCFTVLGRGCLGKIRCRRRLCHYTIARVLRPQYCWFSTDELILRFNSKMAFHVRSYFPKMLHYFLAHFWTLVWHCLNMCCVHIWGSACFEICTWSYSDMFGMLSERERERERERQRER